MLSVMYLTFSVLVAGLAIGQRGGFFLYLILGLILSPLISLLILIIAAPAVVNERSPAGKGR